MKKIASILLLSTIVTALLYNVVDYYMLISYDKEQKWVASMRETPNSKFKIIKLNATLYTFIDDTGFENVNENIVIKNKTYHIFKKRIKDNVLYLYYLPNKIQNSINGSLKKLIDNQSLTDASSGKIPVEKLVKFFCKDYVVTVYERVVFSIKQVSRVSLIFNNKNQNLLSGHINLKYPPPKQV